MKRSTFDWFYHFKRYTVELYSRDLKSDHAKSRIFEGRVSNGPVFKWLGFSYGYSYNTNPLKTGPFKMQTFLSGFQKCLTKWWFQMVGLPDFRSHSKCGPFATQPLFNHSKFRLVRISDPHCSQFNHLNCFRLSKLFVISTQTLRITIPRFHFALFSAL